jgi:hypothetical protein
MALVASLCFLSATHAALAPRKAHPDLGKTFAARLVKEAGSADQKDELLITEETEIKLDGRACKYQDVPGSAAIILLELASNKKAVLRIHFRTKK